jgi:RNA polymerase sigma-70 factor (ECF subfamily)
VELYSFDDDYLDRLRQGDPATEQHFVTYFEQLLKAKLRARMLPPDTVKEVCQETFYRVIVNLRKEGGIHQANRFGAFVNSTCNFILSEDYRRSQRTRPVEEEHFEIADKTPSQDKKLDEKERCSLVRRILNEMPSRDQQILRDLFLNELDKDEVCGKYGVTRDYLRVLVHRAKDRFRSIYSKDQDSNKNGRRGK